MNAEDVAQLVLGLMGGLGLGTFLNNWLTRRWEEKKVGSEAIGNIVGQLIGVVGSAKDQVTENERILTRVEVGELEPDHAQSLIRDDQVDVGMMVMSARIMCEAAAVDVKPLLDALEEYNSCATEVMRQQKNRLGSERADQTRNKSTLEARWASSETALINASVKVMKSIKKAKF